MNEINDLSCHPKAKHLHHCFLLSRLSWNLTIADISITQMIENLDSIVSNLLDNGLNFPLVHSK